MIPRDFSKVTYQQALEALAPAKPTDKVFSESARLFYEGDHWQQGRGWVGPKLDARTTSDASAVLALVEQSFCARNVVKEIVERHTNGVIGREPYRNLSPSRPMKKKEKPSAAEKTLIDEANAVLTEWWDERALLESFQKAAKMQLTEGRAVVRAFVPSGLARQGQAPGTVEIPGGTLAESLSRIYVEVPEPGSAAVYEDKSTRQKMGVFGYKETLDDGKEEDRVELTYLDENRQTVFRILNRAGLLSETKLDLGGRLPLLSLEDEPLITPTILQNQKSLNRTLTMQGRNSDLAGFTERTLLNAQLPGKYVDAEGYADGKKFVPDPILLGPGITNNFTGLVAKDENTGAISIADPSVVYHEPADPDTFLKTEDGHYRNILSEADQTHALIAGDATATGEARRQAREGFETRLRRTKTKLDRIGRALIEVVLAMAAVFSRVAGRFSTLRGVFECHIDTGSQSLDEQRQTVEAFSAGLLPLEMAMERIGIEDTEEAVKMLAAEREAAISAGMQRARTNDDTETDNEDADSEEETPVAKPAGQPGNLAAA